MVALTPALSREGRSMIYLKNANPLIVLNAKYSVEFEVDFCVQDGICDARRRPVSHPHS